ncbi:hypothetical protein [Nannocystis exedens]|nr:hypothetical protein [Nannocystis exedens]
MSEVAAATAAGGDDVAAAAVIARGAVLRGHAERSVYLHVAIDAFAPR